MALLDLVKKITLSSLSFLTASSTSNQFLIAQPDVAPPDGSGPRIDNLSQRDKKPRLILKQSTKNPNEFQFASHRSHRSHSSHRSHYSSQTGSQETRPKPKEKETENKDRVVKQKPVPSALELGSRVLKKGMEGKDVFDLERLLVATGYKLEPDSLFDELTEVAVMDFQSKKGVPNDGTVGPLTIYYLKHK